MEVFLLKYIVEVIKNFRFSLYSVWANVYSSFSFLCKNCHRIFVVILDNSAKGLYFLVQHKSDKKYDYICCCCWRKCNLIFSDYQMWSLFFCNFWNCYSYMFFRVQGSKYQKSIQNSSELNISIKKGSIFEILSSDNKRSKSS